VVDTNSSWLFQDPGKVSPEARRDGRRKSVESGTDREDTATSDAPYVVYALLDPRDRTPFYVGQGDQVRPRSSSKEENNTLRGQRISELYYLSLEPTIKLLEECSTQKESWEWEMFWIDFIGRKDLGKGPLLNMSDGGNGVGKNRSKDLNPKKRTESKGIFTATYLPEEVFNKLKVQAKKEGRFVSGQIRHYILQGLQGFSSLQHPVRAHKKISLFY
jgi:hypothetical protein